MCNSICSLINLSCSSFMALTESRQRKVYAGSAQNTTTRLKLFSAGYWKALWHEKPLERPKHSMPEIMRKSTNRGAFTVLAQSLRIQCQSYIRSWPRLLIQHLLRTTSQSEFWPVTPDAKTMRVITSDPKQLWLHNMSQHVSYQPSHISSLLHFIKGPDILTAHFLEQRCPILVLEGRHLADLSSNTLD